MTFPDDSQRLMIVGPTGSGKTVAAIFQLAYRRYDEMPWLIFNYKRDELIDGIPGSHFLELDQFPRRPGIYIYHPEPQRDQEWVDQLLRQAWKDKNTGIYIDEMLVWGQYNQSFRLLLTQGRSLHCPIIGCTQRPRFVDMFAFSEADFLQVFRLRKKSDVKTIQEHMPEYDGGRGLRRYHSYYYDVVEDTMTPLRPVPDVDLLYRTFYNRLKPRRIAV